MHGLYVSDNVHFFHSALHLPFLQGGSQDGNADFHEILLELGGYVLPAVVLRSYYLRHLSDSGHQ